VGIARAARLALSLGSASAADAARQEDLLRRAGLPVDDPPGGRGDVCRDGPRTRRRRRKGQIRLDRKKIGSANLYDVILGELKGFCVSATSQGSLYLQGVEDENHTWDCSWQQQCFSGRCRCPVSATPTSGRDHSAQLSANSRRQFVKDEVIFTALHPRHR